MSKRTNLDPTGKGGTVVGLFKKQVDAERAISRLKADGFSETQIGVAMRDRGQQKELEEGTGAQAAEGAAAGALGGGLLGGVLGLLAGVGALAIPGIGPIVAGGALASTLAGAGIGAAAGGLIGALTGMGIPEEDARHFDQGFRAGGTLVTVSAGNRAREARECLSESGADLGSTGRGTSTGGEEESLRKRQVQDTEQVSETVRREEARIEQTGNTDRRSSGSDRSERWRGSERRYGHDAGYSGPERRMAEI